MKFEAAIEGSPSAARHNGLLELFDPVSHLLILLREVEA
jgi:hypothetical protein